MFIEDVHDPGSELGCPPLQEDRPYGPVDVVTIGGGRWDFTLCRTTRGWCACGSVWTLGQGFGDSPGKHFTTKKEAMEHAKHLKRLAMLRLL